MGKIVQETLAIAGPVIPPLLKLHDAAANEPVPQGEADVDGLGGKLLRLLMNVNDAGLLDGLTRKPSGLTPQRGSVGQYFSTAWTRVFGSKGFVM